MPTRRAMHPPAPVPCADDRQQLWGEKVGMVEPFAGNAATAWGTSAEPKALEEYRAVTGQRIASCMFQGGFLGLVRFHCATQHAWGTGCCVSAPDSSR